MNYTLHVRTRPKTPAKIFQFAVKQPVILGRILNGCLNHMCRRRQARSNGAVPPKFFVPTKKFFMQL